MHRLSSVLTAFLFCVCVHASDDLAPNAYNRAYNLYNNGLWSAAMTALQGLPQAGHDPMVDGYIVLCAYRQHSPGYENLAANYMRRHASSSLCDEIRALQALDLFDKKDYEGALELFNSRKESDIPLKDLSECVFKTAYCHYMLGNEKEAVPLFEKVLTLPSCDYTAPSQFNLAYINYLHGNFNAAEDYFAQTVSDERFTSIAEYYIICCRYEKRDYDYVVAAGVDMHEDDNIPAERKAHLARIISESYLVLGDKTNARQYFAVSDDPTATKTRSDYFYAGNLMYTTGDWKQAIENYSVVVEQTDSLSQIAWYQMAFSYNKTKNQVAALNAFRQASEGDWDPKMKEDAFFNYAKLAFDLNGDTSGFAEYIKAYSDKVRGEKIYSYMALAALQDKDWQSAIDAYDRIDMLEGQEKNNYVHANYLRGAQLLDSGSYRLAQQCFQAVTYYSPKNDLVNQLSRYSLAEAYYRDSQWANARDQFKELYNASALYGMEQAKILPYNVAYCCMRAEEYDEAAKWFDIYVSDGGKDLAKDALTRKADCIFATKNYKEAASAYGDVVARFSDANDIYPIYQQAVCYGLSKNNKQKIKLLGQVLKADPSAAFYPEALLELSKAQQAAKDKQSAAATLQKLVDTAPTGPYLALALLEQGTMKRNAKDTKGALECYKRVVEELSDCGYTDDALLAIESIYQSAGTPDKYLAYLDQIGRGTAKTEAERTDMVFDSAVQIFYSENYSRALTAFDYFCTNYPDSPRQAAADYYIGECHRHLGDKIAACDSYRKVLASSDAQWRLDALRQYADLSYSLENFTEAYDSYKSALELAQAPAVASSARMGMTRSAYKAKNYEDAILAARASKEDSGLTSQLQRESAMILGKSLLATSRRSEAMDQFSNLAADPSTPEGSEAAYLVIQDCFDRGDFEAVTTKAFALSDSGKASQYWLAKSFIVLGDTFAEQGKLKQAKATFQSIADGYKTNDEVKEEVQLRLDRLKEMEK